MEDQTTQVKQQFLREEILESNYDPDEFINFLKLDLKVQELDVSVLQMRVLQSIVAKFKQYKYYQQDSKSQKTVTTTTKPIKRNKIQYDKYSAVYDYEFEEPVKCVQVEPFSKNLEVYIPKIEIKQKEGIFFNIGSKTEIWFVVQTNLNKTSTRRLEDDFQWLSDTVIKLYPLIAVIKSLQKVPELISVSKESEENNEKRRKELEQFIQILASTSEMKQSNLFYQFLTTPPEKMQKMKKNFDSMSFVRNIHSIKNQTGKINIIFNNKERNFVQSTASYVKKIPKIHENISESVQKIMENLQNTSKQIYKIVDYFAEMHQSYNQIINKSPEYKINQYSQILINTNNLFHAIANDIVTKVQTFSSNLKQFSKISLNHDKSINKLFKSVAQAQKDYVYFKSNLNRKKERIYPQVSKWQVDQRMLQNRRLTKQQAFDMMLPRETLQQEQQKQWMAYLYNNYKQQFQKYLTYQIKRYTQKYCTFCSQLLLNNKNYVQELTKFIQQSKRLLVKG